jgi:hypothetical protein
MTGSIAFGSCLVLALAGWGKMVVDDVERRRIWTPLCVWTVFLFPLYEQGPVMFSVLVLALFVNVTDFLADGDAYLYLMYAFTCSASGLPAIIGSFSAPLLAALVQELGPSSNVAMAPFLALGFVASWTVYLAPFV